MIDRVYLHTAFILVASIATVTTQEGPESSKIEIGRGSCGSQRYYAFVITCAIPEATPAMTLSVSVLRQISRYPCRAGQNFGVAADNSYLWVSSGCQADFSISEVTFTTTTTARPTTTKPTLTTRESTTPTRHMTTGRSNVAFCGQTGTDGYRIIGGTEADTCQFPWMVMIYDQLKSSMCGGSIIDSTHVATAAHCLFSKDERTNVVRKSRANELLVFSGSSTMPFDETSINGLMRRAITEVITHESYNHTSLENDIAILKLSQSIIYDQCHKPICMVDGSKTPHEASNCRTMGWGITSNGLDNQASSQLQYVNVSVVSDDSCRAVYGPLSSSKTFCAGNEGRDACEGDSGGPFTCQGDDGKNYIYGIVSAGVGGRCGIDVGIYTKVTAFLDWINNKLQ